MSAPSLTICMPGYKAERYLAATLESVVAQTYAEWELILVEDGSHDRTEEIVAEFAKKVSQPVRFIRHEKNQGLPATRNTAIALARSDWIVPLDSDDLWTPSHLAELVACAARQPDANLVHGGSILFDSDSGRELEVRAPSPEVVAAYPGSLFAGDYIVQPSSVMLKKSLWTQVGGFDPEFRYVEDREMWMRCARAGAVFAYTGFNSCLYRKHGTALTAHSGPMAVAAAKVYDKAMQWEAIPLKDRRQRAANAWSAAGRLVWRENPHEARDYFRRALGHSAAPRTLAYWAATVTMSLIKRDRRPPAETIGIR